MGNINVLDKGTINQIAAGEVIDRPASIIKELVENSIDAGAKSVSIEIKGGGIDLIRITDNGSGIARDDIRIAFVRHTTSKIKTAEDLSCITSLGFRGEALASIAAVADVELITKTKDDFSGVRFVIGGGEEKAFEDVGAPDGTTFIIRDVFKYVPVRRKFLKSSATEGSYCNETVERIALSHPEVSIKYVNNGRNVLFTNGSGKMKDVIFGIYGRDIASAIIELDYTDLRNIHISGCICKPVVVRNNRNTENYYVNGRYIRSQIIYKAIEDAYQPYLMQHKYPFTALYIEIDPAIMDVNVHPSKQEVRFENPEAVYQTVYSAITDAFSDKALIHKAEKDDSYKKTDEEQKAKYVPEPFEVNRRNKELGTIRFVDEAEERASKKNEPIGVTQKQTLNVGLDNNNSNNINYYNKNDDKEISRQIPDTSKLNNPVVQTLLQEKPTDKTDRIEIAVVASQPATDDGYRIEETRNIVAVQEEETEYQVEKTEYQAESYKQATLFDEDHHISTRSEFNRVFSTGYRIVGQIFDTYWIIESAGSCYIIDQHAAHEKILYEKFMKSIGTDNSSQLLSPPLIISLSAQEEDTAERFSEELAGYGFVLEHFGGHEYALSEIPLNLYGVEPKDMLLELLDELGKDIKGNVIKGIKEKIATCACKAAVKGNTELSEAEARELIKLLLEAENPFNCPHGRPIIIDVTKREIEKKFKRIL
ncbi:MAG: DNA mismatch repair endonuclease MutL [Lachnospiraceae bacterium]|nr:DNA mismatch repair endonuclease MutL [Lachnospiraceae bacterium]